MDAQVNCPTCGAAFHQHNSKQKYCSATCRNKALYAIQKEQLGNAQKLVSLAEQLARSEERVKELEAQIKDLKQLEQDNEALRAGIQQLATQAAPSLYHIELRTVSITQVFDQGYYNYYLDNRGNKILNTRTIYLSVYAKDGTLLSEREVKGNDDLLYLMERNNIADIELTAGL
jgi:TolA-binding protein